ncbi:hypothetical protein ElyMa_002958300 [Elysia marginata]|uniref:Uncharacterized protein n=1 Tax=Elysia marginata TaxID=1093978 RepID=A0AAV4I9K9_9GAST|nr:hypothetical protein ElyMa_002958300 [Elysia marginata]
MILGTILSSTSNSNNVYKKARQHGRSTRQELSWSHLLVATVSNYQSWLVICFIIFITAAAVLIGYHAIVGPRYKTTNNPDVFLNQSGRNVSPSASFIQQSSPIGKDCFFH